MIARVETSVVLGIDTLPIEVEVDVANGLPSFGIVGLPDAACRESQDRVRAAIRNAGFSFPMKKVVVNLAPADVKKEGASFDLPIALGILIASEQLLPEIVSDCVVAGELALDGSLRPITGTLCRASALVGSGKRLVIPRENMTEALCVKGARLRPVGSLHEAIEAMAQTSDPRKEEPVAPVPAKRWKVDFADVKGQALARRGIEVAAAGGHNLLMIGPPGAGKTMLAKRIPTVLADLGFGEAVETTKIHSVAGLLRPREGLVEKPPFRTPHHTISYAAMVGGGSTPRPGEISLAHNGVLFLDELPEFRRSVLETLRQPLEEGRIVISRAAMTLAFPARFMLVGAMNPCPCGYLTDYRKGCTCTPIQVRNYLGKISGPLLDRIDIHLYVGPLRTGDLTAAGQAEASQAIRDRIRNAREAQACRYGEPAMLNARLEGKDAERHCLLTDEARRFLLTALDKLRFSGRAYHKVLKIGRTVADLDAKPLVELAHVQEALQYRGLDRQE